MRAAFGGAAPVSDLNSHIGFWLRFVSNQVSNQFARALSAHEVSVTEWVVLRQMYGQGDISPSRLSELTGLTRSAISKIVDALVVRNFVVRRDRGIDRRYQNIAVTPGGKRLVPMLAAIADENDEAFFGLLSKVERNRLMTTLRKLVDAHGLYKLPTE